MKKKRWSRYGRIGVVLALYMGALPSQVLAAPDSPLQIAAQVGWEGTFKAQGWTTMNVTLVNSGGDFHGQFSVVATNLNQGNVVYGSFAKTVAVPAGKTAQVKLEVPSSMFLYPVNLEVTDDAGQEVLSQKKVIYQPLKEGLLIGGLVQKDSELTVFSLLAGTNEFTQVREKALTHRDVPTKPELLDALDMLELNSAEQSTLTTEQVQAIHNWVQSGGHLLLSGATVPKGNDVFADISPVRVTGTEVASELADLRAFTGVAPNVSQLPVRTGTLQAGADVLVQTGDVPLLAWREVGRGAVLYAAYDVGAEPLASWQGNKVLWKNVLTRAGMKTFGANDPSNPTMSTDQDKNSLISSSGSFRQLAPPFNVNLLIFIGYLVLIGPLLFWLLRRAKKQTLAWVLVPSTAVLAAVIIYQYGTASRAGGAFAQVQAQIQLESDQHATLQGAATFLVQNGGTYSVQVEPDVQAFATKANFSDNDWGNGDSVVQDGTQSKVVYRNVDYWSPRGAFFSREVPQAGIVQHTLQIDSKGHLVGKLTNQTAFDLDHVFLAVGAEAVPVRDLKKGQTVQIDAPLHDNIAHAWNGNESDSMVFRMFPSDKSQHDPFAMYQGQRSLIGYALSTSQFGSAPIQLFAFTGTPLPLFQYTGAHLFQTTYLTLVRQDVSWQLDAQGSQIPMGLIRPTVIDDGTHARDGDMKLNELEYDRGFIMSNGQLTLDYDLQIKPGFVPTQVKTDLDQAVYSLLDKQLYNWQTKHWDAASSANTPVLAGSALKPYVSPAGHLQIRLVAKQLTNMTMLTFPHVGVSGKGGGR